LRQADEEYIALCSDVPNRKRREFCGMMAQLDAGIANVTQALVSSGLWDDTLLLFTSDNGANLNGSDVRASVLSDSGSAS
jgi:arylsulfatase A-like enzyme